MDSTLLTVLATLGFLMFAGVGLLVLAMGVTLLVGAIGVVRWVRRELDLGRPGEPKR